MTEQYKNYSLLSNCEANSAVVCSDRAANKLARMAWAVMAKGERYKEPAALAA
jgi:hypothetical protein